MSSQNMKSGMPLKGFRKITISHDDNLSTLLICVYRPILNASSSVMYFNIFYVN